MSELAIFDLDYTITRKGTWGRFVNSSLNERPAQIAALWASAGLKQVQYKMGVVPRVSVKAKMLRHSIAGRKRCELGALADDFVTRDVEDGLNGRVVEALREHKRQGHVVLIASAAVDILVERYARALDADGYVCTALSWCDENRLMGRFGSENCYGPIKVELIRAWLDERGIEPTRITAYSDCRSDAPMLEMADAAVVIPRCSKARAYAERMGFEIW
ncbi:MAG: HAD-IB family hydrolase [Pseudomonadota bacterium]